MSLSQFEFILFLILVVITLVVFKDNTIRKSTLLIASICFYCYWDYRFCLLLAIPIFVDFYCGRLIHSSSMMSQRRRYLLVSICINIGILIAFKYFNFFIDSFKPLLKVFGLNVYSLDLILPLGISFYTLKTLTYTIDLYYKKTEHCESLLDYAVFVTFFPTIVAGPILRASHFLPQLTAFSTSGENLRVGIRLFVIGLFKKLFIADNLAFYVDSFYASPLVFDSTTAWFAVISYTIQIYFDFSGYSDMAIGSSRIMGLHIEDNFYYPYLSTSIGEFWRRWHISLSTWIRDYLYIPLGGNRKNIKRTYINLLISMLLCGLWHGAAWTFVFWGGYHGAALCFHRAFKSWAKPNGQTFVSYGPSIAHWFITFFVVTIGWIFFRSPNFSGAIQVIGQLFFSQSGVRWIYPFALFIIVSTTIFHILKALNLTRPLELPEKAWYTPAVLFCLAWLVFLFHASEFKPFIYAKF